MPSVGMRGGNRVQMGCGDILVLFLLAGDRWNRYIQAQVIKKKISPDRQLKCEFNFFNIVRSGPRLGGRLVSGCPLLYTLFG